MDNLHQKDVGASAWTRIRFYLAYASAFGQDIPYSEEGLALMHNAELADSLGKWRL